MKRLFDLYGLMISFKQHTLVRGFTVRSYLIWLKEKGRVNAVFSENLLLWKAV